MRRTPLLAVLVSLAVLLTGCGAKSSTTGTGTTSSGTVATAPATAPGSTAGSATGSTQCPTSNTTSFAKTKFVLHTGLAFGAFHRYVYKPFKAGSFKSGTSGRIKTILKAGAAALFIKREVRLASEDVKANPTLCKTLAAPLAKVGDGISGAISKLKGGDTSAIEDLNSTISGAKDAAGKQGAAITENENAPLG